MRSREQADRKLFMLGVDAVSLPFIRDNLDRLPCLASLLATGVCRELESSAAYLNASVWPTFLSGRPPGEHGQYFPFQWAGAEQRYRRIADRHWSEQFDCEPFWHRVSRAGIPTIAFDIGHALHDERAPGLQISNWSQQSTGAAKASHPAVLRDIQRRFGRRPIGPEVPVPKSARQCTAIRDTLIDAVRKKADATLYLMDRPWGLFVTGWYEVHRAGHNLWPVDGDFASEAAPDAMLAVYEEMDRQLARVVTAVERAGEDSALIVFALHGMEPNRAQDHFLAEIMTRLNRLYRQCPPAAAAAKPAARNAVAFLRRALPPTLQYRAASVLGERVQDWVVNQAMVGGAEWADQPAIVILSGGEGLIRLNLKGREAPGYFDPESQELVDYVAWLRTRLMAIIVSETGEPLIDDISLVDELYPGTHRNFLPDLVIRWRPEAPAERISSPDIGEIEISLLTGRGGNHNSSAFMIARGDDEFLETISRVDNIAGISWAAEHYLGSQADQSQPDGSSRTSFRAATS